jgi:hypothetical protein
MAACVKYAADPTFDAWGEKHGEQILAHLQVGTTGHTCTLWHLTPWRYAVVLAAMRCKVPEGKWGNSGGPQFYKHDMAQLAALANRVIAVLAAPEAVAGSVAGSLAGSLDNAVDKSVAEVLAHLPAGLHALPPGQENLPPLVPGPMIDVTAPWEQALVAPTVVAWKTMVLHWVSPTGDVPRYTFTVPLTHRCNPSGAQDSRGFSHLRRLAAWKEARGQERDRLLDEIRADKVPWAGGQVHKFPGVTEADNIGFWEELMASRDRVERHIAQLTQTQ